MTITNTNSRMQYTGDGSTTVFPYTFKVFAQTDLVVTKVNIATEAETTMTLTTDYTVSGVGVTGGGNVTMVAAPSSAYYLVIRRVLPLKQTSDYVANDDLDAETLEANLDKLTMITQQLQEQIDRCVQVGLTGDVITQQQLSDAVEDALAAATAAAASATTAAAQATIATAQATIATAQAALAAASAALIPTPGGSDAGKVVTVKADHSGYELDTPSTASLGNWTSPTVGDVHLAATDGFVVGSVSLGAAEIYTDADNPPTTRRCPTANSSSRSGFCCPVKKGHYWKAVASSGTIDFLFFIPLGT